MLVRLSAAVAAICILSGAALAQGAAKLTDAQIAHIAYTAGQLDIEAAKQALSRSTNNDVRAFAEGMVSDHTAVNKKALDLVKRFGSVTVLNGHIHQVMQKVEGNVTFHTATSTSFPQPAPGSAPSPGPMKVPDDQLRKLLGITQVNFKQGQQRLAIIDTPLQG